MEVRPERVEVAKRPLERRAVVQPRTQHKLRVDADTGPGQAADIAQAAGRMRIFHKLYAQRRVGCMDRNIDRRDAHLYNTVYIGIRQVGQGNIIAEQKRHAAVVILKIERIAHTGRHLIDETKHAFVFAGMLPVHQIRFKLQPDVVVFAL